MSFRERIRDPFGHVTRLSAEYKQIPDRVIDDLHKAIQPEASSFVAGQPEQTAFNEGRRSVWLHIMRYTQMDESDLREIQNQLVAQEGGQDEWPNRELI